MAHSTTEFTDYIALIVKDGGPESYAKVAGNYEEYQRSVHWSGPWSVSDKWQALCADVVNSQTNRASEKHRLFDAGCGTGFVAEILVSLVPSNLVEIYGGDLSPDMLEKARAKNLYSDLQIINLKEALPYEAGFFRQHRFCWCVHSGSLWCSAECLPNLMRVLKKNGYLILTCIGYSDKEYYDEDIAVQWKRQVRKCNCELVEDNLMPYRDGLEKGAVLVIRKL